MNIMISIIIIISLILITLCHPLSLGLILIIQTVIIAITVGYIIISFLFAYIITIIILRGALVLFIYIARIARNEKFNVSFIMLFMRLFIIILTIRFIYLYNNELTEYNFSYEQIRLIKIFNSKTSGITLIIIIYLLITIIAVSNIARVKEGPLRVNY